MTTIDIAKLQQMFTAIAHAMANERDRLCELDGAIGDADHGIAMELGFSTAAKAVQALDPETAKPSDVFNTAAKTFLNAVGASCGPLYATALMRAGASVKGMGLLTDDAMVDAFGAMANGIRERGKAELGEKTMVDAWTPAADACKAAHANGASLAQSFATALEAADAGAEATTSMIATKGRASRLGERAIGHMDPGAASAVVVIRAIGSALADKG